VPEPLRQRLKVEYETDGLEDALGDLEELDDLGTAMGGVSNFDEVAEWYEKQMPDRRIWVLSFVNDTEYARYLHDKVGYWVMNDTLALNITARHLRKLVNSDRLLTQDNIEDALEDAAKAVIAAYTRVVGQKMTAGREMSPPRPKHKGQWADDTVTLAKNFEATLIGDGTETVADSSDYSSPSSG